MQATMVVRATRALDMCPETMRSVTYKAYGALTARIWPFLGSTALRTLLECKKAR